MIQVHHDQGASAHRQPIWKHLYFQVLVAITVGGLIGHFFPETGEMRDTPVYDGAALVPGMAFTGPVIIERMGDTIVLPSFAQAKVDGFANVVIDVGPARSGS